MLTPVRRLEKERPMTKDHRRPSRVLRDLEITRLTGEFGAYVAMQAALRFVPRGDGHGVLVVPGFMVSDVSTWPLRSMLRRLGYDAAPWRLGRNLGPTRAIALGLPRRLKELCARRGRRVSLVGVSLGGVFARDLASRHPDLLRQVITLGSPFRLPSQATGRHLTHAEPLYRALAPWHVAARPRHDDPPGRSVPFTAVFTRTDGVVPWRACMAEDGPTSESVEVWGSHSGLGHNPLALAVVADRLAQPDGAWQPFQWSNLTRRADRRSPLLGLHADPDSAPAA
jgi:pimeloyl-ACP methyl ester carboxylesterase